MRQDPLRALQDLFRRSSSPNTIPSLPLALHAAGATVYELFLTVSFFSSPYLLSALYFLASANRATSLGHPHSLTSRMWQESEATTADFYRVSHLVRSQLTVSLVDEGNKTWLTLEQELLEGEYRDMRERQMDWIEQEDGVMSSYAVRTLRGTVRDDALEVVREQR